MDKVDLGIPRSVLDSLPEESVGPQDMERALEGYERSVNATIETADDDAEIAREVLDVVEHLEDRAERYDAFVPELRAWGQSPIHAIAWRNFCVSLIDQLYDHADLGDRLDRERTYRIADDGIRLNRD
ncbi:hypothetical protein [Halosegnis sp.]|uniref:hypothetical protein n=1 Tax=Halosegnis sp. TaxID=2864959 RepID=UPI0035D41380